jgi:hypothetical protein
MKDLIAKVSIEIADIKKEKDQQIKAKEKELEEK